MAMPMDQLLVELSQFHFPNGPATSAQIEAFEAHVGWRLDEDLRAFYLHCNGATLFKPRADALYRFLSLSEIRRARLAIRARDEDQDGAPSVFTLVDMQDSDYVVVDVTQREANRYPLFDAFHETFPETERIASSFEDFLKRALHSGNRAFWLRE
jgi:hypothetical protein